MRAKKHFTEVLPRSGSLKNNPDSVFKRGDLIQVYEPYEGYMLGQYMGMLGIVMETFTDNISIFKLEIAVCFHATVCFLCSTKPTCKNSY